MCTERKATGEYVLACCLFATMRKEGVPIPNVPRREKTCLRMFANNTGADQPAHPRSLISAFVIRLLGFSIFKGDCNPDDNYVLYERS